MVSMVLAKVSHGRRDKQTLTGFGMKLRLRVAHLAGAREHKVKARGMLLFTSEIARFIFDFFLMREYIGIPMQWIERRDVVLKRIYDLCELR